MAETVHEMFATIPTVKVLTALQMHVFHLSPCDADGHVDVEPPTSLPADHLVSLCASAAFMKSVV